MVISDEKITKIAEDNLGDLFENDKMVRSLIIDKIKLSIADGLSWYQDALIADLDEKRQDTD